LRTVLAIDIGSSKTVALIADIKDDELSVTGVGISKSSGIKKGAITNIDLSAKAIKQAVSDAKRVAGVSVNKAIVSISTNYTKNIKSFGIVNVPTNEITLKEINRAIQTALYNASVPNDYIILQAIPSNFKVDDMTDIEDPSGMSGSRLEVSMNVIIVQKSGLDNIKKTLKISGIEIENIVLNSFASSIATLNEDEKELGVALIDIGATTSDLAIFVDNSLRYTNFFGVGSYHITSDLSTAIHTPIADAEAIKINIESQKDNDILEFPSIGDEETHQVSMDIINQVIYARVNETLMILNKTIEESGYKNKIGAGVVLTGGFTKFYNLKEIASSIFGNVPVRIAKPKEVDGIFDNLKSEEFSTVIGLLLYSLGKHTAYEIDSNRNFRTKYTPIHSGEVSSSNSTNVAINDDDNNIKEDLIKIPEENSSSNSVQKIWNKIKNLI
jgi:cell division protein FtsA